MKTSESIKFYRASNKSYKQKWYSRQTKVNITQDLNIRLKSYWEECFLFLLCNQINLLLLYSYLRIKSKLEEIKDIKVLPELSHEF